MQIPKVREHLYILAKYYIVNMKLGNYSGAAMTASDKLLVKYAAIYREKHGQLPPALEERVNEVSDDE